MRNPYKDNVIDAPNQKPLGFDPQRKAWMRINRLRTGHGRSGHMFEKWDLKNDPTF